MDKKLYNEYILPFAKELNKRMDAKKEKGEDIEDLEFAKEQLVYLWHYLLWRDSKEEEKNNEN